MNGWVDWKKKWEVIEKIIFHTSTSGLDMHARVHNPYKHFDTHGHVWRHTQMIEDTVRKTRGRPRHCVHTQLRWDRPYVLFISLMWPLLCVQLFLWGALAWHVIISAVVQCCWKQSLVTVLSILNLSCICIFRFVFQLAKKAFQHCIIKIERVNEMQNHAISSYSWVDMKRINGIIRKKKQVRCVYVQTAWPSLGL